MPELAAVLGTRLGILTWPLGIAVAVLAAPLKEQSCCTILGVGIFSDTLQADAESV